jgi:phosphohistidine phosphatase
MYLYLVRHAIAEDREDFSKKSQEDSLRPLTLKGRKRMQKMLFLIEDELQDLDLIVTSPYVRAKQTAQIISEFLGGVRIIESAELVPHAAPAAFLKWLKSQENQKKILAVGHSPHIGSFASYILSGSNKESFIEFKKSSVALIETGNFGEMAPTQAQLEWLISPKILVD